MAAAKKTAAKEAPAEAAPAKVPTIPEGNSGLGPYKRRKYAPPALKEGAATEQFADDSDKP